MASVVALLFRWLLLMLLLFIVFVLPLLLPPLKLSLMLFPLMLLQADDEDGELELNDAILRKCCKGLGFENGDIAVPVPLAAPAPTAGRFPVGVGVLLSTGVFSVFSDEELFGAVLSSVLWFGSGILVFGISWLLMLFLGELVRLSCRFFKFFDFRVGSDGDELGDSKSIIFFVSLSRIER